MKIRKGKAAKLLAVLLSLCLTMAFLPIDAFATASNTASISVTFRQGSENNGWIETKNGTDWVPYNGPGYQNAEAVRICPNTDYCVDWTGIFLRVNGTDILTDDIRNQLIGENGYTLTGGTEYALENVEFRQDNGGSPGPEPGDEPGNEPAHGGYEGERKNASVTVTGKADFYINDSRMINSEGGTCEVDYTYNDGGTVDFYFNCFISERITALKINGEDYYNNLPNPSTEEGRAALLAACKGQLNEFKITVPYSESGYAIESSVKWLDDEDADYMVVGNFLWTYTDQNQGDDYIDHGRMELINVKYNGTNYSLDDLNNPGTAIDWSQDENCGSAVLPVGAVVTVKLVPEYGYQLTAFGINGSDFGTGDEQSIFTFEIKPGNAHLGAHFTSVEDRVTSSSDTVTNGSIELGSALSGGSAQLEISDAKKELSNEKMDAFEAAAGNYTITDYVNLDLYNVYYKGSTNADDVWKNEVDTLEDDAIISVSLADSPLAGIVDASNIVIIHNIHNGEDFETIPVDSYDSETNTITFKTDSFSTYAIATVGGTHTHTLTLVPAKDSTCTGAGNKAYYTCDGCDKWFEDATGAVEITDHSSVVLPAKGHTASNWKSDADNHWKECNVVGCGVIIEGSKAAHSYGDDNVCDICGYTKPVNLLSYSIIEGANSSWTKNTDGTLTFRANGDFSKFTGVKVDDTLIDAKNYTAASGSTIITLKADYLNTLAAGEHTLTVVYTDGECSTKFEGKKAASEQTKPTEGDKTDTTTPQTGDNSNLALWFALLFVSGIGILGTTVYNKRKRRINE